MFNVRKWLVRNEVWHWLRTVKLLHRVTEVKIYSFLTIFIFKILAMGEKPENLRRPDNRYSGYGLSHSMPEIELQEVTNIINGGTGSNRGNSSKDSLAEKISTMRTKNATIHVRERACWDGGGR